MSTQITETKSPKVYMIKGYVRGQPFGIHVPVSMVFYSPELQMFGLVTEDGDLVRKDGEEVSEILGHDLLMKVLGQPGRWVKI